MKIKDYKDYLELKEHFKELGKDYDKLLDKLNEKELLIDELRNYIEVLEAEKEEAVVTIQELEIDKAKTNILIEELLEENRTVYSQKTQIELLEEEKLDYIRRIQNFELACEDFKTAYSLVSEKNNKYAKQLIELVKENTKIKEDNVILKVELASKNNILKVLEEALEELNKID